MSNRVWLMCLLLLVSGCETSAYYWQAAKGQMHITFGQQTVAAALETQLLSPEQKQKLKQIPDIRDYASKQLYLPDNGSYRKFVYLDAKAVVWNVVAAPEFSIEPVEQCFPIAGCVSYRGYFQLAMAEQKWQQHKALGRDVMLGGVAAYSTLGWFDDPIMSTMLSRPIEDIAGLLFHELAHQVEYRSGETAFNESFATAVEQLGVQQWLQRSHVRPLGQAQMQGQDDLLNTYQQRNHDEQQVVQLLLETRAELATLYQQTLPDVGMRELKKTILSNLKQRYQNARDNGLAKTHFDGYFKRPINNARLAAVADYQRFVPYFVALFEQSDHDWRRFYQQVKALPSGVLSMPEDD